MEALKFLWQNIDKVVNLISLLISALAFYYSVKSSRQAAYAQELATREFYGTRSVVLKGSLDEKKDKFLLAPIEPQIALQAAFVYFPSQLKVGKITVSQPGFEISLTLFKSELIKFWNQKFTKREEDKALVLPNVTIPIIIESYYVSKGEPFNDRALYYLDHTCVVLDNPDEPPSISINGLLYGGRLKGEIDPEEFLKNFFEERLKEVPVIEGWSTA